MWHHYTIICYQKVEKFIFLILIRKKYMYSEHQKNYQNLWLWHKQFNCAGGKTAIEKTIFTGVKIYWI